MDRVVRKREAAEVTSDNFWLLVKGSFPWLFWLPAFLLFWLLVLAVLKDTPDMGEANMSAVSLTGELTGERNCSAMAGLVRTLQHGFIIYIMNKIPAHFNFSFE